MQSNKQQKKQEEDHEKHMGQNRDKNPAQKDKEVDRGEELYKRARKSVTDLLRKN